MTEISGARVVANHEVARATRWLVLDPEAEEDDAWEPGHIVAIYLPDRGGHIVRHPYSIALVEGGRLHILYRVVSGGRVSPGLAELPVGATVRLGGRFGEPIRRLAPAGPVVGVSTGTGIGPLYGYARSLHGTGRSLTLLSGFREEADVALAAEIEALVRGGEVVQHVALSRPAIGPSRHVGDALAPHPAAHWHLVGNGAMTTEVREALLLADVPAERITVEAYHNHRHPPDPLRVAAMAARIRGR